jgi:DNA invertase Pin-like site-specific DNA recombinase
MIRAAVYCRFSTDLQSEKSIEDQIALCRAYAERTGLTVTQTYANKAKSGSSTIDRQAWQKLMRDADARMFDVLVTEDIDPRSYRDSDSETRPGAARRCAS